MKTRKSLTRWTKGRIIKTVRGTKGSTQNREGDFAERRSQWPRRWLASRLCPRLSTTLRAAGIMPPPRFLRRCSSRLASRARRSLARLARWTRILLARSLSWATVRLRLRTSWLSDCPRLRRRRRLRLSCASPLSWVCLRRWWMVRRWAIASASLSLRISS